MATDCLVNFCREGAKMDLHQDRGGKTETIKLASGDVLVMGGPSRLCYHGIDRIHLGTSTLLKDGGRINLTLRRVTKP